MKRHVKPGGFPLSRDETVIVLASNNEIEKQNTIFLFGSGTRNAVENPSKKNSTAEIAKSAE